jgi:hypothetical protein
MPGYKHAINESEELFMKMKHAGKHVKLDEAVAQKQSDVKTQSEHTPTPWAFGEYKDGSAFIKKANDTVPLADLPAYGLEAFSKTQKANAELIVRAVNSFEALTLENTRLRDAHDALVQRNEELKQALQHLVFLSCHGFDKFPDEVTRSAWVKASDAIAKAEGR